MTSQKKVISSALFLSLCCLPAFLMARDHSSSSSSCSSSTSSSSSEESHHSHCHHCKEPTPICHVPYTINEPGKYCVERDLHYNGDNAAIVVAASNVTINFHNHSLVITNPNATGILIDGQSEVAIENDAINYTLRSSVSGTAGVLIFNSEKISLNNLLINNAFDGVFAQNSYDIRITHTRWTQNFDSTISTVGCAGIYIDDCTSDNVFEDFATAGMAFLENTQNVHLSNLNFHNTDIWCRLGRNATVENVNTVIDDPNYVDSACQFGSPNPPGIGLWEQALIKNCNFAVLPGAGTATGGGALFLPRVLGVTVENCVLECNTGGIEGNQSSGLTIGANAPAASPPDEFSDSHNVRVANCVIQNTGSAQIGVFIDSTPGTPNSGIVIENCDINGFTNQDVFVDNTTSCVISNSNITDGFGDGVFLGSATLACSVLSNIISNNCGNAVTLDFGATTNLIKGNTTVNNGADIIDYGTNTLLVGNVEFSNNLICNDKIAKGSLGLGLTILYMHLYRRGPLQVKRGLQILGKVHARLEGLL